MSFLLIRAEKQRETGGINIRSAARKSTGAQIGNLPAWELTPIPKNDKGAVMGRNNFWPGFLAGTVTGGFAAAASALAVKRLSRIAPLRALRLGRSVDVGRPGQPGFQGRADPG